MKSWDAIVVGAGIIGLSLARELHKRAARVLLLERGKPGREASHAAAGMLAYGDPERCAALQALKLASARLYPEFVREIEDESRLRVDFRREGTISIVGEHARPRCEGVRELTKAEVDELEPGVRFAGKHAFYTPEESVDNRALVVASSAAAKHRGIDIASGTEVTGIDIEGGQVVGVVTSRTKFAAPTIVNCAGAWAGALSPAPLPVHPRKGQMLAVVGSARLRHVLRGPDVYLVPRSDGRILIGATVEDAGYDKRVDPQTIERLRQAAANLLPEVTHMRMLEAWAGLRPAAPDGLPILGATELPGYLLATAHFRNGILLAPVTAQLLAEIIAGEEPSHDLREFSPARF